MIHIEESRLKQMYSDIEMAMTYLKKFKEPNNALHHLEYVKIMMDTEFSFAKRKAHEKANHGLSE